MKFIQTIKEWWNQPTLEEQMAKEFNQYAQMIDEKRNKRFAQYEQMSERELLIQIAKNTYRG